MLYNCFVIETGIINPSTMTCGGDHTCLPTEFCGKATLNPDYGATSFDNILYALLNVF
jgi:hypothetical protein